MEYLNRFAQAVMANGFSWKNVVFFILFVLGLRSLFLAVTSGDLNTGWLLSGNVRKAPVIFFFKLMIALLYLVVCGYLALGFGNKLQMFHLFANS